MYVCIERAKTCSSNQASVLIATQNKKAGVLIKKLYK